MSPKVSVVIPVYNASAYLPQCLDTILLQTLMDIEVICVNDGSTDNSSEVLAAYTQMDERLKVIHQENAGAAVARNRGMKEATGEYIIFLDADDFFAADMLEKMLATAQKDQSDVVVCGWWQFSQNEQKVVRQVKMPDEYIQKSPLERQDIGNNLFLFAANVPWNKLIRLDFLKKTAIRFDEQARHADDVFFGLCSIGAAQKISVMLEPFIYYRIHSNSQTAYTKETSVSDLCQTLSRAYLYLKECDLPFDLLPAYINRVQSSLLWFYSCLPQSKMKASLCSIQNYLHSDLYKALFGSRLPAVSIIVPVYNAAKFLPECLDSCIHQTLEDIEIICVNDGSTDNSLDILQQYARRDKRIKIITQENQGLPISRANAMKIASGEYIQFLDSDDYLDLDTCKSLYLYSKLYDLEMLLFSAIEFKNESGEEFEQPYHCLKWLPENFIQVFSWQNVKEVIMGVAVTACLTFYKHDFLKENDIHWINQRLCYEDSPFFIESFFKAKRVGALPEKLYHRRVHGAAITQNMANNFPDYCKICRMTLKIAKQYADDEAFSNLFLGYAVKAYKNYILLPVEKQKDFRKDLSDLYDSITADYHLSLPPEIKNWCKTSVA